MARSSLLLREKVSVLARNRLGQTALGAVVAPSHKNCRDFFLLREYMSALKEECCANSRTMANALMSEKCPFTTAVFVEDAVTVKYLLDEGYGTVHDRHPKDGSTALHLAVQCGDLDTVKLLLQRGADINAENNNKEMPLDYYPWYVDHRHDILKYLLEHAASLNVYSERGYDLVVKIFKRGDVNEIKTLLLLCDIDFNVRDWHGSTLLSIFMTNGDVDSELIGLLQEKEFDVNAVNKYGRSPLWFAVYHNNPTSILFLLKRGANSNNVISAISSEIDRIDYTEVYFACNPTRLKCLDLLLQFGADIMSIDGEWKAIFDIALQEENIPLLYPVFEHVLMKVELGENFDSDIFIHIQSDHRFVKYFNIIQRKMKKVKGIVIDKSVTLFNFLTEPQEKLLKYARNPESVKILKCFLHRERHSKMVFIKNLRKRLEYVIEMAELRKQAALGILKIVELQCNWCIIDKIVLFLDKKSLKNVCQI